MTTQQKLTNFLLNKFIRFKVSQRKEKFEQRYDPLYYFPLETQAVGRCYLVGLQKDLVGFSSTNKYS
jgi:hypothetical protein